MSKERYIASCENDSVTVADLGQAYSRQNIVANRLYAAAPKTVYRRSGKHGTRLTLVSGDDTPGIRRAARRLFAEPDGYWRLMLPDLPQELTVRIATPDAD